MSGEKRTSTLTFLGWLAGLSTLAFLIKFVMVDGGLCTEPLANAEPSETLRQAVFRIGLQCATPASSRAGFAVVGSTVWIADQHRYGSDRVAYDRFSGVVTYEHFCGDVIGLVCGGCGGYGRVPRGGLPGGYVPVCANFAALEEIASGTPIASPYRPLPDEGDVARAEESLQTMTLSSALLPELEKVAQTRILPRGQRTGPSAEVICCSVDDRPLVWVHWNSLGSPYWGGVFDQEQQERLFSYIDAYEWDPERRRQGDKVRRTVGALPIAQRSDRCGDYERYRLIPYPPCPPLEQMIEDAKR